MGAWGYKIEECDTYLDLLDSMLDVLKKEIDNDAFLNPICSTHFVCACELLYQAYQNQNFYYNADARYVDKMVKRLKQLLDEPKAFDSYRHADLRRREVEQLYNNLLNFDKTPRSTTLMDKIGQVLDNKE